MKTIQTLCCSLLLVTMAFAQRPARGAHALIGTWRLVEFADLGKDGKWQYWFRARAFSSKTSENYR